MSVASRWAQRVTEERRQSLRPARRTRPWPIWLHLVVAIVVLGLVQGLFVKVYRVPSGSMEQTLPVGRLVAVDRISPRLGRHVERQQIIVFTKDESWPGWTRPTITGPKSLVKWLLGVVQIGPGLNDAMVKRVIGLPGDTVSCCSQDGSVQVNGASIQEPYIYQDLPFVTGTLDCTTTPASQRCFGPITVPSGSYLVMGDHRDDSSDSVLACRGGASTQTCARFAKASHVVGFAIGVA